MSILQHLSFKGVYFSETNFIFVDFICIKGAFKCE